MRPICYFNDFISIIIKRFFRIWEKNQGRKKDIKVLKGFKLLVLCNYGLNRVINSCFENYKLYLYDRKNIGRVYKHLQVGGVLIEI